jgi:hypothetical protein
MPTEEALDHAVYHGSVPHSVRATKRCGRTAIVAPARLYSLSSEVLADGGNDDGIALVSIPFVQPFPWSALADLCAGFDQVVWLQIGGSHSQEAIRAAYLQQLCGRPVREALVCREGVGAFTRERCKAEIRAAIGINREAQHGDGLFERGSI